MTAFGPQSANYTTTRPGSDAVVSGGTDTWFKDCSGIGVMDGTIPTASWFNTVTANLRTAVSSAGVTLDDTDDTMVWQAMQAAAAAAVSALTASRGVERDGDDFQLTVGQGVDPALVAAGIDPLNDLVVVYDASGTVISESTVYNLLKSALTGIDGITFNDAAGTITGTVWQQSASATPPAAPNAGDEWFDTDTDELFKAVNDGVGIRWVQIA